MQRILSIIGCISALFFTGCASTFETPTPSETIGTVSSDYSLVTFNGDYENYRLEMASFNIESATLLRDQMVNRIITDIDTNYGQYKGRLHSGRAGIMTAGDVVSLGLSAAGTVVGGTALKAILAAADTGLKGSLHSYDKNFYAEQTTEILITRMDSLHQAKKADIRQKLLLKADKYTFEEAKDDLTELFYDGTREAALVALAADAGKKADDTQKASDLVTQERIDAGVAPAATPQIATLMRDIQSKVIYVRDTPDPAGLSEGVRILTAYGATINDKTNKVSVLAQLNTLKSDAANKLDKDPTLVTKLHAAMFGN